MSTPNPEYKQLHNDCEFLNALHVYAEFSKEKVTSYIVATHYYSHIRKDLRQLLMYDSPDKEARLIVVEYMVPKHAFLTLTDEGRRKGTLAVTRVRD
jgi:hypothetical protein